MRFEELDLQLVKWKSDLPPEWREATVRNIEPRMDPNLTLAHLTHNASVILLHQFMAYPTGQLQASVMKLPQNCSADKCVSAAKEIRIITQKYLIHNTGITSPQFAFCLFVSARSLLAHSTFYKVNLFPEFYHITKSLFDLSHRWQGLYPSRSPDNLPERFARSLLNAYIKPSSIMNMYVDIRKGIHSVETESESANTTTSELFKDYIMSDSNNSNDERASSLLDENTDEGSQLSLPNHHLFAKYQLLAGLVDGFLEPDPLSFATPPLPLVFQEDISSLYQNFVDLSDDPAASNFSALDSATSRTTQISNL